MLYSPSRAHNHKDQSRHKGIQSTKYTSQHGNAKRFDSGSSGGFKLLELPTESLTHITSSLDPTSLLSLARANKRLHEHVKDENTWRRAYAYQFMGIAPEGDIHGSLSPDGAPGRTLMLRREETSWKREFVHRWNLKRRWEKVRLSTRSHAPVDSDIAGIHLMPSASPTQALLTASLRYGVVARSYPLTGKILRGYLDASGILNGLGNGNPNAEFAPDVTRCVLSADGGTARVIWGFRTGAVAVTVANRAMELARAGARYMRSTIADSHEGAVIDAAWVAESGSASNFFVTGGADGRVKIWDAKRASCIWTSPLKTGQVVKDPCVKVAVDGTTGVIAVALKSGEIVVWTGFHAILAATPAALDGSAIQELRIAPPSSSAIPGPYATESNVSVASFYLHCETQDKIIILCGHQNESRLYRITIHVPSRAVDRMAMTSETMGAVTAVQAVFTSKPGEHGFVIVGDQLGRVNVFPLKGTPVTSSTTQFIPPSRTVQAHDAAAVTALAWTSTVLLTGSSKGSLRAFDSISLSPLRSFTYVTTRPSGEDEVKQIVVDRDFFAASIANCVVAWRGEPQGKPEKTWKAKRSVARASNAVAKYHHQVEISREIHESRRELDLEQEHVRRNFGREREQHSTLEHLGLSEVEAVEYILMLSRDEEERRRLAQLESAHNEVLLGEFDEDVGTPTISRPSFLDSSNAGSSSFSSRNGVRLTPSTSSTKIQVSPRHRPEPMEAGFAASSPLSLSGSLSGSSPRSLSRANSQAPSSHDETHFPSMGSTPTRQSVPSSPQSVRSAWSTPLRSTRSSEGPSQSGSVAGSPTVARSPGVSLLSAKFAAAAVEEEEDEDLKFALQLSLAEARSRGEDV